MLFLLLVIALAAPVNVSFNGTVSTYFVDPISPDLFSDLISPGTTFDGHFVFDSAAIPTPNPSPTNGIASYLSTGLPYEIGVSFGGIQFLINGAVNVGVGNNIGSGVDQYTVFAEQGIAGGLNDY